MESSWNVQAMFPFTKKSAAAPAETGLGNASQVFSRGPRDFIVNFIQQRRPWQKNQDCHNEMQLVTIGNYW